MKKIILFSAFFLIANLAFNQNLVVDTLCQNSNYIAQRIIYYPQQMQQIAISKGDKTKYFTMPRFSPFYECVYSDDSTLVLKNSNGSSGSLNVVFAIKDTIKIFHYSDVYSRSDNFKLIARRQGNDFSKICVQNYYTSEIIFSRTIFQILPDNGNIFNVVKNISFDENILKISFIHGKEQYLTNQFQNPQTYTFKLPTF